MSDKRLESKLGPPTLGLTDARLVLTWGGIDLTAETQPCHRQHQHFRIGLFLNIWGHWGQQ